MRVAIIMGSTSDLNKVEPAISILKEYGVKVDVRCLSAHRAHKELSEFIEETPDTVVSLSTGKKVVVGNALFFRRQLFWRCF